MSNPEFSFLIWDSKKWVSSIPKGFSCGSAGKESACSVGGLDLISRLERSSGGGHGNPLQNSYLENPHGQKRMADHKELDTTEKLSTAVLPVIFIIEI